jgi:cation diffusion facilitator family transporter
MAETRSPHDAHDNSSQTQKKRALQAAIALSLLAFAAQIAGSIYTGSLALLGDTAHLFTDLFSLVMSLVAIILAARPATEVRSFGLYRLEVLSAFVNGVLLFAAGAWLLIEAVERLRDPQAVLTVPLMIVAAIGLVLNLLSAFLLSRALKGAGHHHHHHGHGHGHSHDHGGHDDHHHHNHGHAGHDHAHDDRNLRAAMLHVLTDALGSVAVVIGAVIAHYTGWNWVDPVLAIILSLMILRWAWHLIHDSGHVLLEGTPRHLRPEEIVGVLRACDSRVSAVEDLHVWEITSRMYAATAEIRVGAISLSEAEALRQRLHGILREKYGIGHAVLALKP